MTTALRPRASHWSVPRRGVAGLLWRGAGAAVILVAAVGLGYILAGDGQRGGDAAPFVILAIGFLPFAAAAVFIDPRFGLAAIPLVYPFGVNQVPKTPVEVVQFLIVCVVLLGVLSRIARGAPPLGWSAPLGWVLALLAWSWLSLPSAADHGLAIKAVLGLFLQFLLVMAVVGICQTARDVARLMAILVVVIAAVGLTTPADASAAKASYN